MYKHCPFSVLLWLLQILQSCAGLMGALRASVGVRGCDARHCGKPYYVVGKPYCAVANPIALPGANLCQSISGFLRAPKGSRYSSSELTLLAGSASALCSMQCLQGHTRAAQFVHAINLQPSINRKGWPKGHLNPMLQADGLSDTHVYLHQQAEQCHMQHSTCRCCLL